MRDLYLLGKMYLLLWVLVLGIMVAGCGQKGDLVHPSVKEPPQKEESKSP